jgi:hypothetical protein
MPDYSKSLSAGVRAKISIRRFFKFLSTLFQGSFKPLSSLFHPSCKSLPAIFFLFPLLLLYDFCLMPTSLLIFHYLFL